MKTQNTGLIFCSQFEQKFPINISNIKYFNSNKNEIAAFFDKYFIIQDEVLRPKLKKYFVKKSINDYIFFLSLVHNITPIQSQVIVSVSNSHTLNSIFRYSTKTIKKSRVGRVRIFGNVRYNFDVSDNGYITPLRTILNSSHNFAKFDSDVRMLSLSKRTVTQSIDTVTGAIKIIKENVFSNFGQLVSNFFNDILHSLIPSLSRRDLKNEIQIVGSKTTSNSALVIEVPYERLAVINFIKKLGLENFYSDHINIPRMVEAIRMYELGEHKAFKEYTTYAVNRALIAIERKLLEFNDEQRLIALQEMNNLDSLKFIVELITDDELYVNNSLNIDETYLALPYKI